MNAVPDRSPPSVRCSHTMKTLQNVCSRNCYRRGKSRSSDFFTIDRMRLDRPDRVWPVGLGRRAAKRTECGQVIPEEPCMSVRPRGVVTSRWRAQSRTAGLSFMLCHARPLPRPHRPPMPIPSPAVPHPLAVRSRPGWQPAVDADRCTGCGWCVAACEPHVLALETAAWRKRSVLQDATHCTGCSECAVRCPFHAITMVRASPADLRPED